MSVRANTYAVLMGSLFLALALVFAGLLYATRVNVVNIELKAASAEMSRIVMVVSHERGMLDTTTQDWAIWDDAYDFVAGRNPRFVQANLASDELSALGVNALVFLDRRGTISWGKTRGLTDTSGTVTPHDRDVLLDGLSLAVPDESRSYARVIGGKLVVESVRPIVRSDDSGPAEGTLIAARVVDLAHVRQLAGSGGDWIDATSTAWSLGAETRQALTHLSPTSPVWVMLTRPHELMAYGVIYAPGTKISPIVLRAPVRSLGYDGTPQLIAVLVATLIMLGFAWTSATFALIDRTSLSPMSWLRSSVASVTESADASHRIDVGAGPIGEEVAGVANEINNMLGALETSVRAQRDSEQRIRALVENMADTLIVLDHSGVIRFASPQVTSLTGFLPDELQGKRYDEIVSAESHGVVERMLRQWPGQHDASSAEVTFVGRSGRVTPVELAASPILDADGASTGIQWIARDVTERKMFEDQLLHLADHDHLTGLYNRRRFEEELARQLAESRRQGSEGALLWLDLDGFKEINDSLGHKVGDEILVALGGKLRSVCRADQIIARLGGDEFGVLIPHATVDEAKTAARRILEEVRSGFAETQLGDIWITASIGIVSFPQQGTSVEELSAHADLAMCAAKRDGRNRFSSYQPDQSWHEEYAQRSTWATRIESALAQHRFVPFAQPIVSLATGEVVRYELLVRMTSEEGQLIGPAEFLAAAEDLGLIGEIDRHMVREAVRLVQAAEKAGQELTVNVNLSATTLGDSTMLRFVRTQLQESGIEPSRLGFEITETALVRNLGRALHFMNELRALGCWFALDDFGSGFTSFYHLRYMPLDVLKIDGTLVSGLTSEGVDQHLVRAILELAKGLDIRTTAECIETEATLDLVRAMGVDEVQGHLLGRPRPAFDLLRDQNPPARRA